jgi:hypothetical protein
MASKSRNGDQSRCSPLSIGFHPSGLVWITQNGLRIGPHHSAYTRNALTALRMDLNRLHSRDIVMHWRRASRIGLHHSEWTPFGVYTPEKWFRIKSQRSKRARVSFAALAMDSHSQNVLRFRSHCSEGAQNPRTGSKSVWITQKTIASRSKDSESVLDPSESGLNDRCAT